MSQPTAPSFHGVASEIRESILAPVINGPDSPYYLRNGDVFPRPSALAMVLSDHVDIIGARASYGLEARRLFEKVDMAYYQHLDVDFTAHPEANRVDFRFTDGYSYGLHFAKQSATVLSLRINLEVPTEVVRVTVRKQTYEEEALVDCQLTAEAIGRALRDFQDTEKVLIEINVTPWDDAQVCDRLRKPFRETCEAEIFRGLQCMPALQEYSYLFDGYRGGYAKRNGAGSWPTASKRLSAAGPDGLILRYADGTVGGRYGTAYHDLSREGMMQWQRVDEGLRKSFGMEELEERESGMHDTPDH